MRNLYLFVLFQTSAGRFMRKAISFLEICLIIIIRLVWCNDWDSYSCQCRENKSFMLLWVIAITSSGKRDVPSPTWDAGHRSGFSSDGGNNFGTATSFFWLLDVSLPEVLVMSEILELQVSMKVSKSNTVWHCSGETEMVFALAGSNYTQTFQFKENQFVCVHYSGL